MKKTAILILIALLAASHLSADARIKLDVKTKFSDKFDLKGVKHGTVFQLEEEGYEVREIGEDFTVWLKDYSEEQRGKDRYNYKLIISISQPSLLTEKPPIVERELRGSYRADVMVYNRNDDFAGYIMRFSNYFIGSHRNHTWESLSDLEKIRAYEIGRKAGKEIHKMVRSIT